MSTKYFTVSSYTVDGGSFTLLAHVLWGSERAPPSSVRAPSVGRGFRRLELGHGSGSGAAAAAACGLGCRFCFYCRCARRGSIGQNNRCSVIDVIAAGSAAAAVDRGYTGKLWLPHLRGWLQSSCRCVSIMSNHRQPFDGSIAPLRCRLLCRQWDTMHSSIVLWVRTLGTVGR